MLVAGDSQGGHVELHVHRPARERGAVGQAVHVHDPEGHGCHHAGTDGRLARVATGPAGHRRSPWSLSPGAPPATSLQGGARRRAPATTTTPPSSSTRRRCASTPTTSPSASRSTARSCAPRRRTSRRPAGWPRRASSRRPLVEFQLAAELNPANGEMQDELRSTRAKLRAKLPVTREGKTQLETLIESSRNLAPAGTRPAARRASLPDSLVFRDASARDVFISIGRFTGVNVIFDPAYRDATLSIELRGAERRRRAQRRQHQHAQLLQGHGRPRRSPSSPTPRPSAGSTRKR